MPRPNRYGPGIIKQGGTFYVTKQIPRDLQDTTASKRWVQTLHTDSISEARRRAPLVLHEWETKIATMRSKPAHGGTLDVAWFRQQRSIVTGDDLELLDDLLDTEIRNAYGPTEIEQTTEDRKASDNIRIAVMAPAVADHIEPSLEQMAAREVRPDTIQRNRTDLLALADRFPYVDQLTKKAVSVWIDEQMLVSSAGTVRRKKSAWSQFYEYLMKRDIVDDTVNVFAVPIKDNRKRSRVDRQPFTPDQIRHLLDTSESDTLLNDYIQFAAYTGCRVGEITALQIENVDLTQMTLKIINAKSKAGNRTLPIHSNLHALMRRRIGNRSSGLVFDFHSDGRERSAAVRTRFSRLKRKLGYGPEYVFHSIRKTVATMFEEGGVAETTAAAILGHEIKTMSYGLYSGGPSNELKREAIDTLRY